MKLLANWVVQGVLCGALGLFAMASPASSQASPPPSEQAKQLEMMVGRAAAEIDSKGRAAFPEFRKEGSEWFQGSTYLVVFNMKLDMLFDAGEPKYEGNNAAYVMDSAGKAFIKEFAKVAQSPGSGWVDFMWPKAGQTQASHRWAFVKSVTVDGEPGLVEAGFYPQ
jgi:cytochrome c